MPKYRLSDRLSANFMLFNVYLELHGKVFYKVFVCSNLDTKRIEKIGTEFIAREK